MKRSHKTSTLGFDVPSIEEASQTSRRLTIVAITAVLFVIALAVGWYLFGKTKHTLKADSIAFLAFANDSGNPELDFLTDGMPQTMIDQFAGLSDLRVVPRSTAFAFKGQSIDPLEAGKKLGVDAVVTGRLVQSGDTLNAQIELTDIGRNSRLWVQNFDIKPVDPLPAQKEISAAVFDSLKLDLTNEDKQHFEAALPNSSEAYLSYLNAQYEASRRATDGLADGLHFYDQATSADPKFSLAYSGIASSCLLLADKYFPGTDALRKAGDSAQKAIAIDDHLPSAHTSLAIVYWWRDRKFDLAEAEFRRALELDQNDPRTHMYFGWFLITIGRTQEGIEQAKWGTQLDPQSVEMNELLGQSLYFARNYNGAIEQLKQTIQLDPNSGPGHCFLGRTYLRKDQFGPAIEELKKAVEREPNVAENKAVLAFAYARAGQKADAARTFDDIKKYPSMLLPKYDEAKYYIGNGDKERAFELLNGALADNSLYLTGLKVDPELDPIRDDPRFAQLIVNAGLPN